MKILYRMGRILCRAIFALFYRHRVYGAENIPQGAAIIAPNHISYFDPPLIAVSCPQEIHFLARDTLFEKPIFGTLIRNLNALPVSGRAGDLSSLKTICQNLEKGEKVLIFPEGIRTYDGELTQVKPGIAMISQRTDTPIVPTYIHGTFEIWPRQRWFPRPWGKTVCVFGKPIYPHQFQDLDKKVAKQAIANAVRESIENLRKWHREESGS